MGLVVKNWSECRLPMQRSTHCMLRDVFCLNLAPAAFPR
uniref:Uncharacterized protein n=1 Tax=Anguilla anguilla TaxID=7936 RepID=A0A0E9U8G7_ANGAN